ncbi:MAG: hypothetical protein OK449_09745 [Thaumarchaeota archaeon]|nr:hypothetical protein [Nitrososphaerota archaeon]
MSGLRRPRPLDAVSIVFAGFIFLVMLSQLSAKVLGEAVLSYHPEGSAVLAQVQSISEILAVSAAALGLAFGSAVLIITRKKLAVEIDVYRANGLPFGSALRLMLSYHPVRPMAWLLGAAAFAVAADSVLGLDARVPLYLVLCYVTLLIGWVALLTFRMFSSRGFKEGRGRVG